MSHVEEIVDIFIREGSALIESSDRGKGVETAHA